MSSALPLDVFSEERGWEALPLKEAMSPSRVAGWGARNYKGKRGSAPCDYKHLTRALRAHVGQLWATVSSKLLFACANWYERRMLLDKVCEKFVMIDGEPHKGQMVQRGGRQSVWNPKRQTCEYVQAPTTWEYTPIWESFYVHEGVLCEVKKTSKPVRPAPEVTCIPVNDHSALYLENGFWYMLKWRERTAQQTWYTCVEHGGGCGRKYLVRWGCYAAGCKLTKTVKVEKLTNFADKAPVEASNGWHYPHRKPGFKAVMGPSGWIRPPGDGMWVYQKHQVSTRDLRYYLAGAQRRNGHRDLGESLSICHRRLRAM